MTQGRDESGIRHAGVIIFIRPGNFASRMLPHSGPLHLAHPIRQAARIRVPMKILHVKRIHHVAIVFRARRQRRDKRRQSIGGEVDMSVKEVGNLFRRGERDKQGQGLSSKLTLRMAVWPFWVM